MVNDPVPVVFSVLGMSAPAISLIVGVGAVLLVRIMLLSKEPTSKVTWWIYNVALTILMMFGTFVFILDRKLGPGAAMLLGIGFGSSGIVIIDLAKRYLEVIVGVSSKPAELPHG